MTDSTLPSPEPFDKRQQPRVDGSGLLPNGGNILYAKEVMSFLQSFERVDGTQPEALLEEIKAIWREEGLTHPRNLQLTLLQRRLASAGLPETPENKTLYDILKDYVDAGYQPEALTGTYDSKQNIPLITGLSNLYALTVGKEKKIPVTIVEGDFGNMGGTNEHFATLAGHPEDVTQGWEYTDKAARIAANIARNMLEQAFGEKKVFAARNGGDELRLIVVGENAAIVQDFLEREVHPAIERFTATIGLHDHVYKKDKTNDERLGFALSLGAADLGKEGVDPFALLHEAEAWIEVSKITDGFIRSKHAAHPNQSPNLSEDEIEEYRKTMQDYWGGHRSHGENIQPLVDASVDYLRETVQRRAQEYNALKPVTPTLEHVTEVLNDWYPASSRPRKVDDSIFSERPENIRQPRFTIEYGALKDWVDATLSLHGGENLTDAQRAVFHRAAAGYPAIDPATGVLMDRDLPQHAKLFADDAAAITAETDNAKSVALHIETTNIAGFNTLSHSHADAVLRAEANVIKAALVEKGFENYEPVYHLGGGKFVVLLPSAVVGEDGTYTPLPSDTIEALKTSINAKIAALNGQNMHSFFRENNLIDTALLETKGFNADAILGDLAHPSRPQEKGIDMLYTEAELDPNKRGGEQIFALRQEAERAMVQKRQENQIPNTTVSDAELSVQKRNTGIGRQP
jgi:GGDEF domain-containing protein